MQRVISVFGNHAASRDGDDYLISLYNIAPESGEFTENLGNEHRLRKLWIVAQVLLIGIEGNVWRTVCKVCILMLGCKGLSQNAHKLSSSQIRYFTSLFLAPSWIDSL